MIASKNSFEPSSSEALPNSNRIYAAGKVHADVRVPFREIKLSPTRTHNGKPELNGPVRVYDCSGPWGDPEFDGSVEAGLPAVRQKWILARGDVEESPRAEVRRPKANDAASVFAARIPLRAKPGKIVTQLHYARQGIITPEMGFIAIC